MKKTKAAHKEALPGISVVIPVFNNAATISDQLPAVIKEIDSKNQNYEILVSDDKSTDESAHKLKPFAKNKNVFIYYQKNNLGIAKNILYLYKKAKNPYILLFSIDGDWDVKDLGKLIQGVNNQDADIIIGKRNSKDFPIGRRVVSKIYNALPLILFGVKTYDTGSIKIIKRKIITETNLQLESVSFESELLIKAAKNGYKISNIPISYKKQKLNKKSSVNVKLIVRSFVDLLRLRMYYK